MSVASDLRELENINLELAKINGEISRLRKLTAPLKLKAEEANERIIAFCNTRDTPGLKYQGKAIIIETKEKREPKKLANREEDAIRVLSSRGIENPAQVYKEMMEARKGELSEKRLLKIKPI
jgi:hypothetical protein